MPLVRFINPVDHYTKTGPQYLLDVEVALTAPEGILLQGAPEQNEDGSYEVMVVPWNNIVYYTETRYPPQPVEEGDTHPYVNDPTEFDSE